MKAEAWSGSHTRRGPWAEVGIRGESNFSVCLAQTLVLKCHHPLKETRAREEKVLDEPEISFCARKVKKYSEYGW